MVINRLYKILFILGIIISISEVEGFSQGTDISMGKTKHLFIGLSVSPGQSTISNTSSINFTGMKSSGKSSLSLSVEAGYMFSDYMGISTGIGYSTLKSEILLSSYSTSYDTADVTESYKRTITGNNIKEVQEISFLKIPFLINIQIPVGKSLGVYFSPGINLSLPLSKSYEGTGTFTYDGFYSAYNVHITGVPYEGLEKDYSTSDKGGLQIKSLNMELTAFAGISYLVKDNMQLAIGLTYEKLLSDMSDYADVINYRLSSMPDQMRSIMEGSSGATASTVGLRISLRILL